MKNIKTIIFDLGNVVVDLDVQKTQSAFAGLNAQGFDQIFNLEAQSEIYSHYEVGGMSDAEFRQKMRERLGFNPTDDEFDHAFTAMILDITHSRLALLEQLRKRYQLFLFSNTNAIHMRIFNQRLQAQYGIADLSPYFDKVYYSFTMGKRKPAVDAFLHIIDEQGLQADKTLFVDDVLSNVEGAKQAGLQTIHLTAGKTIHDLF